MYRAGSISGSRNHPSNLVGNRNKNKRGRLAEDFFFLFDIKTKKKKQRWKRKERSARQKKEENGWHFSDINRKAREIPITEYFRVPLFLRPFNQRPSKRSGLFIYTPRYVFWCIGTSDEPQKASLSLSLSGELCGRNTSADADRPARWSNGDEMDQERFECVYSMYQTRKEMGRSNKKTYDIIRLSGHRLDGGEIPQIPFPSQTPIWQDRSFPLAHRNASGFRTRAMANFW